MQSGLVVSFRDGKVKKRIAQLYGFHNAALSPKEFVLDILHFTGGKVNSWLHNRYTIKTVSRIQTIVPITTAELEILYFVTRTRKIKRKIKRLLEVIRYLDKHNIHYEVLYYELG